MMKYNGPDYDPALDDKRLKKQTGRIYDAMISGLWLTLFEIATLTGDPESSVSAQLRNLRKPHFGSYIVNKRRRGLPGNGLFEYQLLPPQKENQKDLFDTID